MMIVSRQTFKICRVWVSVFVFASGEIERELEYFFFRIRDSQRKSEIQSETKNR